MTANQIASAEARTHNYSAHENERHNREMEKIENEKNEIQLISVQNENQYKTEANRIQEEWNAFQKEYSMASLNQKKELESWGLRLESEKLANDLWYKQQSAELQQRQINLDAAAKFANITIDYARNRIQSEANRIAEKRADYENSWRRTENAINDRKITINAMQTRAYNQEQMRHNKAAENISAQANFWQHQDNILNAETSSENATKAAVGNVVSGTVNGFLRGYRAPGKFESSRQMSGSSFSDMGPAGARSRAIENFNKLFGE